MVGLVLINLSNFRIITKFCNIYVNSTSLADIDAIEHWQSATDFDILVD